RNRTRTGNPHLRNRRSRRTWTIEMHRFVNSRYDASTEVFMKPVMVGLLGLAVLIGSATAFAQTPVTNRIPQQIVINGQTGNGAYVLTPAGSIQNYTCSTPQTYSTPDGATHGWACLESATGTWLLGALPPQAA